jgi:Flp pilus assembly protein TadD
VQLQPGSAKFRSTLGVALEKCGRLQEAAEAYQRAHEKDPSSTKVRPDGGGAAQPGSTPLKRPAQVLLLLARVLKQSNRSAATAEAYGKVVALQPDHPSAHYKRATVLRHLGRRRQAADCLRCVRARLRGRPAAGRVAARCRLGGAQALLSCPLRTRLGATV